MSNTTSGVVTIIGSGLNAPDCTTWAKSRMGRIVAINNAWRVRPDWDDLIFPEDFPRNRLPGAIGADQQFVQADAFVPAQNAYGGFVFGGATMAFTAAYWALYALRPTVVAFLGCDMVYPKTGPTHFYGTGAADPLRADVSLQDLTASSMRLALLAASQGCACINLSNDPSVLDFARGTLDDLRRVTVESPAKNPIMRRALEAEASLNYTVPDGRIWEHTACFDAGDVRHVLGLWRKAFADLGPLVCKG